MKLNLTLLFFIFLSFSKAQRFEEISFRHEGKVMYGRLWLPLNPNPTLVIVCPGSGAVDRFGSVHLTGANAQCLYPNLYNDTVRSYRDIAMGLRDSGFAVFTYDKIEYTYPTNLGTITFEKLWLPIVSALDSLKLRTDIDTGNIYLLGHSEGSTIIPFVAKNRTDIKGLISLAGPRTPFDSILAYQLVEFSSLCGGNVSQAQSQAQQITSYFSMVRSKSWTSSTPTLFGVPAPQWYKYISMADSVAINYNVADLPTLFLGLVNDINVPLSEIDRFSEEVSITNDFWVIDSCNHYGTTNFYPQVYKPLIDTIIFWLKKKSTTTVAQIRFDDDIKLYPIPFSNNISIVSPDFPIDEFFIYDVNGRCVYSSANPLTNHLTIDLSFLEAGYYSSSLRSKHFLVKKGIVKL